jgi:formylglycine-generating enzyme required for sulfatase activity
VRARGFRKEGEAVSDPKTDTLLRVYRGGSWYSHVPSWVRAASRYSFVPAVRSHFLGFRCARVGSERKVKP